MTCLIQQANGNKGTQEVTKEFVLKWGTPRDDWFPFGFPFKIERGYPPPKKKKNRKEKERNITHKKTDPFPSPKGLTWSKLCGLMEQQFCPKGLRGDLVHQSPAMSQET